MACLLLMTIIFVSTIWMSTFWRSAIWMSTKEPSCVALTVPAKALLHNWKLTDGSWTSRSEQEMGPSENREPRFLFEYHLSELSSLSVQCFFLKKNWRRCIVLSPIYREIESRQCLYWEVAFTYGNFFKEYLFSLCNFFLPTYFPT
jgi:hypothetical protein